MADRFHHDIGQDPRVVQRTEFGQLGELVIHTRPSLCRSRRG